MATGKLRLGDRILEVWRNVLAVVCLCIVYIHACASMHACVSNLYIFLLSLIGEQVQCSFVHTPTGCSLVSFSGG